MAEPVPLAPAALPTNAPPVAAAPVASAEAVKPADAVKRSFEQIVADKSVELKGNKSAAISFAVKNHSAEYTDYRARVQSGEIVKL